MPEHEKSEPNESDATHPSAAPTASDRDDGAAVRTIPDVAGCIPASSSLAAVEAANVTLSTENAQLRQALRVIRKGLSDDSDGEFWPARRWLDRRNIFHGDLSGNRVLELVAKHALHGNIAMPSTGVGLKTVEYLWNNGDFDGLIAFVRELLAGNPLTTEVLSAAAASPALKASDHAVPDPLRGHDAEPRLMIMTAALHQHVMLTLADLGVEDGKTLSDVQRRLHVNTPTAMRLFALFYAVKSLPTLVGYHGTVPVSEAGSPTQSGSAKEETNTLASLPVSEPSGVQVNEQRLNIKQFPTAEEIYFVLVMRAGVYRERRLAALLERVHKAISPPEATR